MGFRPPKARGHNQQGRCPHGMYYTALAQSIAACPGCQGIEAARLSRRSRLLAAHGGRLRCRDEGLTRCDILQRTKVRGG